MQSNAPPHRDCRAKPHMMLAYLPAPPENRQGERDSLDRLRLHDASSASKDSKVLRFKSTSARALQFGRIVQNKIDSPRPYCARQSCAQQQQEDRIIAYDYKGKGKQSTAPQPFLNELYWIWMLSYLSHGPQHQCLHLLNRQAANEMPSHNDCITRWACASTTAHLAEDVSRHRDASPDTEQPHRPTLLQGTKNGCRSNLRPGIK